MIDNTLLALRQRRGAVCILHSSPHFSPTIPPTAARHLGFSYVFNTNLSRRLKETSECRELKKRLKQNQKQLANRSSAIPHIPPLISCECPLCTEAVLREYPTLAPFLTPYKSTIAIQSAIVRDVWAERHRVGTADVFQVAVVNSGHGSERQRLCALAGVDDVVTQEELGAQLSKAGEGAGNNQDQLFDAPFNVECLGSSHKGNRMGRCGCNKKKTVYLNTSEDVARVLEGLARKREGSEEQYAGTIIRLNHCDAFKVPESEFKGERSKKGNGNGRRRRKEKWLFSSSSSSSSTLDLKEEHTEILNAIEERRSQLLILPSHPQTPSSLTSPQSNHLQNTPHKKETKHNINTKTTPPSGQQQQSPPKSPVTAASKTPTSELLVLYGSQSGSTERQAELFTAKARSRGFKVRLFPCDRVSPEEIKKLTESASTNRGNTNTILIIITSTVGDGDLPENAKAFHEKLSALGGEKPLRGLRYAVCGFGNSAFGNNFCIAARRLRAQLRGLGGRELAVFAACDVSNTTAAEARFATFTDEVLGASTTSGSAPPATAAAAEGASRDLVKIAKKGGAMWKKPPPPRGFARIPLVGSVDVTPAGHRHPVREFTFGLGGAEGLARYRCGDHVQLLPRNDRRRVAKLLARLKVDGNTVLDVSRAGGFIPPRVTARELFEQYLDVFTPCPRSVADAALRRVRSTAGLDAARRLSAERSLGEALLRYPRLGVRLEALAAVAPRIQPRAYSVASAPPLPTATASKSVTLSVALVHRDVGSVGGGKGGGKGAGRQRVPGLATGYLWSLDAKTHPLVAARVVRGPDLAADVAHGTVVMCGLGSGIAPYLALMQERARLLRLGKLRGRAVLCYGVRSKEDFVYGPLVTEYLRRGVLSAAFCAIGNEGCFVQDKIAENSALFAAALHEPETRVYYCGPMKSSLNSEIIPVAVFAAFEKCVGSSPEGKEIIEKMKHEHRIVIEAH